MNNSVRSSSTKLSVFLNIWTKHYYGEPKDIGGFLQLLGLVKPLTYDCFTLNDDYSFEYNSAGERVAITFSNYDSMDFGPIITIARGEKTENYLAAFDDDGNPCLNLTSISIKDYSNGNRLFIHCAPSLINITFNLVTGHVLKIEMCNLDFALPKIYGQINEVVNLLSFSKFILEKINEDNISELHKLKSSLIELLKLSPSQFSKSKVLFSHSIEDNVSNEILFVDGKVQRYANQEADGVYTVSRDGNWSYFSDNVSITYSPEDKNYEFSIIGDRKALNINPCTILTDIEPTITVMMDCFKS